MIRAAASSIASGNPSSRRAYLRDHGDLRVGHGARSGLARSHPIHEELHRREGAEVRDTGGGTSSGAIGTSTSPDTWSPMRLVTSAETSGQASRIVARTDPAWTMLLEVVEQQQESPVTQPAYDTRKPRDR